MYTTTYTDNGLLIHTHIHDSRFSPSSSVILSTSFLSNFVGLTGVLTPFAPLARTWEEMPTRTLSAKKPTPSCARAAKLSPYLSPASRAESRRRMYGRRRAAWLGLGPRSGGGMCAGGDVVVIDREGGRWGDVMSRCGLGGSVHGFEKETRGKGLERALILCSDGRDDGFRVWK